MASIEIKKDRNGKTYARIQIRAKNADGEWQKFYKRVDNDTNLQMKTFQKRINIIANEFQQEMEYKCSLPVKVINVQEIEEQKEKIADIRYGLEERERREQKWRDLGVKSFPELAQEWLDHVQKNYSVSYYLRGKRAIGLFNEYLDSKFMLDKPITEIGIRTIQEFFEQFPGQSITTVRGHKRILHAIFNEAIRYEWLNRNPVALTKVGSTTTPTLRAVEEKEIFSIAEARQFIALLDSFDESRRNQRAMFKTLILTGLRSAEMVGLRWEDVDFEHRYIKVRRNRLYSPETGIYEKEPKTKTSIRNVPMSQELIDELQDFYQWYKKAVPDLDDNKDKYYIACRLDRTPIFAKNLSLYLKKIEKRYNLKKVSPHGLRHTYCSILLANNVPIQTVSKYMGHSDSSITLRVYSHFIPESMDTVVAALDKAFDTKAGQ